MTQLMAVILRPMLAAALPPGADPPFAASAHSGGLGATPKVDGIRALVVGGHLVSRTFKPIPNLWIRAALEAVLPEGADGEIMAGGGGPGGAQQQKRGEKKTAAASYDIPDAPVGQTFQQCTSMVMSADKVPAPGSVTFYMFDYVRSAMDTPYSQRMEHMREVLRPDAGSPPKDAVVTVVPLFPTVLADRAALDVYETQCLSAGFEGVMLRRMDGRYKPGRATLREATLLKIKRFTDAEATIVGFEELVHVHSHRANASGLLGAFVVQMQGTDGVVFKIGTGFSAADRAELWLSRHQLVRVRQLVKFKYMAVGVKAAPRFPVFLGLRHADDV